MAQVIAKLDDKRFAMREKAMAGLKRLGRTVEPVLRRALEMRTSLEVHQRLKQLLLILGDRTLSISDIRKMRSITALERIASPDARRILKNLAAGAPGTVETDEAREAIARLSTRTSRGS